MPFTGGAGGHDVAEDASEAAEDCPLHGTGQLPPLAGAPTPEDSALHLRSDPPLPQRKPLHHRWLQGPPALQALSQKVDKTFIPVTSLLMQSHVSWTQLFLSGFLLYSIFILSNETVNIWSHLIGFLLFFSLGVNDLLSVLPASGASREDYVIYAIGLFCFQVPAG